MILAQKVALISSAIFLNIGLISGIWKYLAMAKSDQGKAPEYVDILHRATLLYSFACLVLFVLAGQSVFSAKLNLWAVIAAISFFYLANIPYLIHAILRDTDNQFQKPYKIGTWAIPKIMFHGFMVLLITAELGGALILTIGTIKKLWV